MPGAGKRIPVIRLRVRMLTFSFFNPPVDPRKVPAPLRSLPQQSVPYKARTTAFQLQTFPCDLLEFSPALPHTPHDYLNMNVLTIGGSKNIGYYSSIRLLGKFHLQLPSSIFLNFIRIDAGSIVTFLLRNASCFNDDEKIQKYVASGKAFLCKGDGLVQDDVRKAWEAAEKNGKKPVDLLLFTVGGCGDLNQAET